MQLKKLLNLLICHQRSLRSYCVTKIRKETQKKLKNPWSSKCLENHSRTWTLF